MLRIGSCVVTEAPVFRIAAGMTAFALTQAFQTAALLVALEHAALFVPVSQYDAPRRATVQFEFVNRRPMGLAVDELMLAVRAQRGRDRSLGDVHDRLGLLAGALAAGIAELLGHGDALFDRQTEEVPLRVGIAHM